MMTTAAAAHVTVTMAVTALHQNDGITGVGGNGACRNPRHRQCRCRRGSKRYGDKACFDKSFHWDLLQPRSAAITQVPEPSFVPISSLATRPSKNLGDLPKANRNCRFFPIRLPLRELFLPNADY
jgi:hypothetical protein